MNYLMNDEAVYRTAPATPGLLNIYHALGPIQQNKKYDRLNIIKLSRNVVVIKVGEGEGLQDCTSLRVYITI